MRTNQEKMFKVADEFFITWVSQAEDFRNQQNSILSNEGKQDDMATDENYLAFFARLIALRRRCRLSDVPREDVERELKDWLNSNQQLLPVVKFNRNRV